jgi:hypothetical protein
MREERRKKGREKNSGRQIKKHVSFYAKESKIKNVYFSNLLMILLMYKKTYFNINDLDHYLPSIYVSLLQNLKNIFSNKISSELPPIRKVKNQIDLVP